jgi:hypothetical protein
LPESNNHNLIFIGNSNFMDDQVNSYLCPVHNLLKVLL